MIDAFRNYVAAILTDGDELNDWLTHIPGAAQAAALVFGRLLALITGA